LPFLAIFLQSTLFAGISMKGTVPDIVLIFITFFALLNGSRKGTIYGVLCGLFEDLYMGRVIGINALSKGLVAFIVGKLQGNVFKENILVGIMMAVIATLINSVLVILITAISLKLINFDMQIMISVFYQTIYNSIIAIPIYVWYYNSTRSGWLKESREL
jgi:rod shape-determining protein MreD